MEIVQSWSKSKKQCFQKIWLLILWAGLIHQKYNLIF